MPNLKRLATTCEFGEYLPQALCDRLVFGAPTFRRKFSPKTRDFNAALKVALYLEAAERDIGGLNPSRGIRSVRKPRRKSSQSSRTNKQGEQQL